MGHATSAGATDVASTACPPRRAAGSAAAAAVAAFVTALSGIPLLCGWRSWQRAVGGLLQDGLLYGPELRVLEAGGLSILAVSAALSSVWPRHQLPLHGDSMGHPSTPTSPNATTRIHIVLP